jgi:hypothetical protein
VKRGLAVAKPLTSDEAWLLEITLDVVALGAAIWDEVLSGAAHLSLASAERLGRCAGVGMLDKIKQLQGRYAESQRLDVKRQQANKKPVKPTQQQNGRDIGDF